jgi:hypothetical protein
MNQQAFCAIQRYLLRTMNSSLNSDVIVVAVVVRIVHDPDK